MATRRVKDRARPFSRKHRKYWLPVTGGMLLIGALNVGIGMCSYEPPSPIHHRIQLTLPHSEFAPPLPAPRLDGDAPPPDAGSPAPLP